MSPDDQKDPLDPKNFLLPKKEGGPSLDSASRASAGALFEQEAKAKVEPVITPIGDVSVPAIAPTPPPKEESVVRAIETYGSDINRVVRSGEVSSASIAAAEAERRAHASSGEPIAPQELAPEEKASPMRPVLIIAGALLLLSAAGITAALLLRPGPLTVQGDGGQAPFVAVDHTTLVAAAEGTAHNSFIIALEAAREQVNLSVGLVDWLYVAAPTSTGKLPDPLPVAQFLPLLAPTVPQDLLRALSPQYLLGVHSFDENQAFLLLRVDSYQQAYAAMLAWEPTMRDDLYPLFSRVPPTHIAGQGADAAPQTPQLLNTGFTDRVVDNHDARVIQNDTGDLLLLWTFLDRNTLVIATNEYTLNEVIRRANTASLVPQP